MALIDKFHVIRKAIALVQLFFCIVVFTFSLILLIIGGVAHASASGTSATFYQSADYLSGSSLLISAGLFGIIIAFIGALGAIPCLFDRQDNLNLWIGLIVLVIYILVLVGIFIFEIAAGGWAYAQWNFVSGVLERELREEVQMNYQIPQDHFSNSVDLIQMELKCCGITNGTDWKESNWFKYNYTGSTYVPSSCCSAMNNNNNNNMTSNTTMASPKYVCQASAASTIGCWEQIENILRSYTLAIAGVAIALAILQLIITLIPIALLVIVIVELRRSRSLELK